jgi:hypothetical protein
MIYYKHLTADWMTRVLGLISSKSKGFSSSLCPDQLWGPPSLRFRGTGGPFPRGKAQLGHDADHSPPSSTKFKNKELYFLSPLAPAWHNRTALFYFTLLYLYVLSLDTFLFTFEVLGVAHYPSTEKTACIVSSGATLSGTSQTRTFMKCNSMRITNVFGFTILFMYSTNFTHSWKTQLLCLLSSSSSFLQLMFTDVSR